MKRFFSLIIALILVFSMFAVTAVAFAAPDDDDDAAGSTATHVVTFNTAKFAEHVFDNFVKQIEMNKEFMFGKEAAGKYSDEAWFNDYEKVHEIFEGIQYLILEDEKDVLGKDDEGFEQATKYTISYDWTLPETEPTEPQPEQGETTPSTKEEQYQLTQHVKLDTPDKVEGWTFVGWSLEFTVSSEDVVRPELTGEYLFPAGFEFNMPATAVTAKAKWVKEAASEDDEAQQTAEDESEDLVYSNDRIYVLYTNSDRKKDMKDWTRCEVSDTFSLTSDDSEWFFRFAVIDGIQYAKHGGLDWDKQLLATTFDNVQKYIDANDEENANNETDYTLVAIAQDTTKPEITLSEKMKNDMTSGLTVGTKYQILTTLDITDATATSANVTYKVYKKVGKKVKGADSDGWLLIYDSVKKEVTEGYSNCMSTSGAITPIAKDVTGEYVYKIVYSIEDPHGNVGVNKEDTSLDYVEMLLKVKVAPVSPTSISAIDAWKIVLYVIAGLSAAGIVVLLCIKPKQAEATADARYNASAQQPSEGGSNGDTTDGDSQE